MGAIRKMCIIDGKKIAEGILEGLKQMPKPKKFLAAFSVVPDEATKKFLGEKKRMAGSLGVDFRLYEFKENITQDELRKEILKVVLGSACGGAIIQLPLPDHIDAQYVLNAIPREKDVDVLGERALGAFYAGRNPVLPPAVAVVKKLLTTNNLQLTILTAAVVGLGRLVGKPVAHWFQGRCENLFLLDKGSDFSVLKNADIVVCGAGDPGIVTPDMLKDDALVIDFGYGVKDGPPSHKASEGQRKLMGDFNPSFVVGRESSVSFTPTPGGTGPILVAKLFENFYALAEAQKPAKKKSKFYPQIH